MDVRSTGSSSTAPSSKTPLSVEIKRAGDQLLEVHVKRSLDNLNKTIDELFTRIEEGEDVKILEDLCPY